MGILFNRLLLLFIGIFLISWLLVGVIILMAAVTADGRDLLKHYFYLIFSDNDICDFKNKCEANKSNEIKLAIRFFIVTPFLVGPVFDAQWGGMNPTFSHLCIFIFLVSLVVIIFLYFKNHKFINKNI